MNKPVAILPFYNCLFLVVLILTGCFKDYSYGGGPQAEPLPPTSDTVKKESILFPVCASCTTLREVALSSWNFKNGASIQCGQISNAIMNFEKNAFTFFGPSSCSADTGLIITAYFEPAAFTKDKFNVTTDNCLFQYYNNTTSIDIFQSWPLKKFTVTIESYYVGTGIATGSFKGIALTEKGDTANISAGRFKVQMK